MEEGSKNLKYREEGGKNSFSQKRISHSKIQITKNVKLKINLTNSNIKITTLYFSSGYDKVAGSNSRLLLRTIREKHKKFRIHSIT